ncbi:MAG: hydrogenase expression/formation protein HypE [Elusimicrobiales bacterium]|nr:hydrogenase expression/formation protein HypE [Elusimicrobiales bacterium]
MKNLIKMEHGSGGKLTFELIKDVFLKELRISKSEYIFEDSYVFKKNNQKIAFTTDSYVVSPLFFPGGDIGRLSICGTVNDLAVSGAIPYVISAGFIIEEGFEIENLKKIVSSMKKACDEANVKIVCGDTKVVEKGKADGVFINTTGIGFFDKNLDFSYRNVKPGDLLIINGEIAAHGIAVMNERHKLGIKGNIKSDVSPLNGLISTIKDIPGIRCIKDLTRGGLAEGVIEISSSCGFGIEIEETSVPINKSVKSACEILGIDPLYVANEGKIVVIVDSKYGDKLIGRMKKHYYGKKAVIIGRVLPDSGVYIRSISGMRRMIISVSGEQLPRIC